jgi:hypothetical protein
MVAAPARTPKILTGDGRIGVRRCCNPRSKHHYGWTLRSCGTVKLAMTLPYPTQTAKSAGLSAKTSELSAPGIYHLIIVLRVSVTRLAIPFALLERCQTEYCSRYKT